MPPRPTIVKGLLFESLVELTIILPEYHRCEKETIAKGEIERFYVIISVVTTRFVGSGIAIVATLVRILTIHHHVQQYLPTVFCVTL